MKDEDKTKKQLVGELMSLRQEMTELQAKELQQERATETLQLSEKRFEELADLLPQTVFECDKEGKLTFVNRNSYPTFGYSQEDFNKGLNILQAMIPEDRDRARENIVRVLKGEKVGASEYTFMTKDGRTFPAIVYSSPVIIENEPVGLRGIVIDITDRKRSEEALRESERRYRILADHVTDVIFTMDMDLRFTHVSPSAMRLVGYTPEEIMGQGVTQLLSPNSAELAQRTFEEEVAIEASGKADPFRERVLELELVCKDGSSLWTEVKVSFLYDPEGRPVEILGIARNITERRCAEQALRESEQRLRALFDRAAAGMALVDMEGRILAANEATCRFLGYSPEEIVGMHLWELAHPEDRDKELALNESLVKGKRDGYLIDKRFVRKHGEVVWGRLSVSLIRDPGGQPQYVVVVAEDITSRRRAEESLRESEARYRAVMEQSPDGIYLVDVETREIMEANSAFQKLLGYTYQETLGLSFYDFVVADREDLDRRFTDVLMGKGPFAFERRIRRKDGSFLDVWVTTKVISFGGRKMVLVLIRDLTEFHQTQSALQESEARYRAVMEQSPDGIYLVDVESKRLLQTNPAFQKMLGYSAEEMERSTPYEFTAADRENINHRFLTITTSKTPLAYERQFRKKDGSLLDAWVNANVITFGGRSVACFIVRDLTERKRAEEERERIIHQLEEALANIKTLRGLIPICANCKKIRDDSGYWQQVEIYVRDRSQASFSHGLCPECTQQLFPCVEKREEEDHSK